MSREHVIGPYSAYAIAVKYGYTGTEEQWVREQEANRVASEQAAQQAEQARGSAETAASRSESAADRAETAQQSTESIKTDAITAIGTNKQEALDAVQTAKDGAVKAVQTAHETATKAVSTAQASATAAVEKKGKDVLDTIPEDYTNLNESVGQLKEDKLDKPANPVVGQVLRVKSIDETGKIVLETVAGGDGGGGVTDVTVGGKSVVADGVANIPTASSQTEGVVKVIEGIGGIGIFSSNMSGRENTLYIHKASTYDFDGVRRTNSYPVCADTFDYAVKAAMTDGIGKTWTDTEKTGAWTRLTSIKKAMDDVAVAGAKYFLGEQTALSITMPTDAQTGQEIMVVFSSGQTACTLAVDLDDFDFVPKANSMCKIVFLCVAADTWLVDAKEG